MPNAFNFSSSPFDCLTSDEQRLVRDSVDVVYFRQDTTILDQGIEPSHLFILIKGFVTEYDGDDIVTTYGPNDSFDGRALIAGKTHHRFVATEEVVAYQLERQAVQELIADNATFGALLFSDLGDKLQSIAARKNQHELESLTMARVDEAFLRAAVYVDADTDILSVVRLYQAQRVKSVLVRDTHSTPSRMGIFTSTMVQVAVLDGHPLNTLRVGQFANFKLVTVRPDEQLGDAMALMLRHRVHRLVVMDEGQIQGILEAMDLFSYLSNQSHLITEKIEDARDLEGLRQSAIRSLDPGR